MARLNVAAPHFIRCVKPNLDKQAANFDGDLVSKQLRYTGMLETTRIRREGFSYRPLFIDFVARYKVLAWNVANPNGSQGTCRSILDNAGVEGYCVGKTKVFLRYWHVDQLNAAVKPVQLGAIALQSVVRGFLARQRVRGQIEEMRRQRELVAAFVARLQQRGAVRAAALAAVVCMCVYVCLSVCGSLGEWVSVRALFADKPCFVLLTSPFFLFPSSFVVLPCNA